MAVNKLTVEITDYTIDEMKSTDFQIFDILWGK